MVAIIRKQHCGMSTLAKNIKKSKREALQKYLIELIAGSKLQETTFLETKLK